MSFRKNLEKTFFKKKEPTPSTLFEQFKNIYDSFPDVWKFIEVHAEKKFYDENTRLLVAYVQFIDKKNAENIKNLHDVLNSVIDSLNIGKESKKLKLFIESLESPSIDKKDIAENAELKSAIGEACQAILFQLTQSGLIQEINEIASKKIKKNLF